MNIKSIFPENIESESSAVQKKEHVLSIKGKRVENSSKPIRILENYDLWKAVEAEMFEC